MVRKLDIAVGGYTVPKIEFWSHPDQKFPQRSLQRLFETFDNRLGSGAVNFFLLLLQKLVVRWLNLKQKRL